MLKSAVPKDSLPGLGPVGARFDGFSALSLRPLRPGGEISLQDIHRGAPARERRKSHNHDPRKLHEATPNSTDQLCGVSCHFVDRDCCRSFAQQTRTLYVNEKSPAPQLLLQELEPLNHLTLRRVPAIFNNATPANDNIAHRRSGLSEHYCA